MFDSLLRQTVREPSAAHEVLNKPAAGRVWSSHVSQEERDVVMLDWTGYCVAIFSFLQKKKAVLGAQQLVLSSPIQAKNE